MKKRIVWIVIALAVIAAAIGLTAGKKGDTVPTAEHETAVSGEEQEAPTEDAIVEEETTVESMEEADVKKPPKYTEEELENIEYEDYIDMPGEEQEEVFESYEDPKDFFDWYNSEKEEYEQAKEETEIVMEGGVVDAGDWFDE